MEEEALVFDAGVFCFENGFIPGSEPSGNLRLFAKVGCNDIQKCFFDKNVTVQDSFYNIEILKSYISESYVTET